MYTESKFRHARRGQYWKLAGYNYGRQLDRAWGLPLERERGLRTAAASGEFHSHGPVETAESVKKNESGSTRLRCPALIFCLVELSLFVDEFVSPMLRANLWLLAHLRDEPPGTPLEDEFLHSVPI